jgi:Cu-Zn family superoxide dismutase
MKSLNILVALAFCLTLSGYGIAQNAPSKKVEKAVCVLYPTLGNKVTGVVTFTKVEGGVKVVADIEGLSKGKHGFHIHEYGDCSGLDGSTAGGHFNPDAKSHGAPNVSERHAGDMGNIEADDSGQGTLEYVDSTISLEGKNSIIGKAMIIHANEDDLKTQPTGNAGNRLACGVIGIAK